MSVTATSVVTEDPSVSRVSRTLDQNPSAPKSSQRLKMAEFQAVWKEESMKFEEEEVYEVIQAPKWVDFTIPDRSLPDDKAWFCLQVGCDQKHETMDPAALHRSFLLRVMAARSPNIRLGKALSRQMVKCPLSAPPKSTKNRTGFGKITTLISQKAGARTIAETGLKINPVPKLQSTPNSGQVRQNSVTAKALTTPKHKKCSTTAEPFRSIQNSKARNVMPKNRMVAKALVFQSPKKTERVAASFKNQAPVSQICAEMKQLEISSGGNSCQSSRCATNDPNYSVPASSPVKSYLRARKLQRNQIKKSPFSQDCEDSKASSKLLKKKGTGNLQKNNGPAHQMDIAAEKERVQEVGDETSDMDIEGHSRNGSLEASFLGRNSGHCERNGHKGNLKNSTCEAGDKDQNCREIDENAKCDPRQDHEFDQQPLKENTVASQVVLTEITSSGSLSNSKARDLEEKVPMPQTSNREEDIKHMESDDDKENASASANNSKSNLKNTSHSGRKLRKIEACKDIQKAKTPQGNSTPTTAHFGKHYKIKPTNPKPFRLRTDERGILKEANLERRLHLQSPLKETAATSKYSNGNLQRKNRNEIKQRVGLPSHNPSRCRETKMATNTTQRQKLEESKQRSAKQIQLEESKQRSAKQIQNKALQQQLLIRPLRVTATTQMDNVIKEALTITESKAETCKASAENCNRSVSRGKRPGPVPREPNFHRIHVPKTPIKKTL